MPAAITTLRAAIKTALTADSEYSTMSYVPATLIANSVVIAPDAPYLTPNNNTKSVSGNAAFRIICTVPALDNQGSLEALETMIAAVYRRLAASTIPFAVLGWSQPTVYGFASGDLLSSDIQISTPTEWT